MLLKGWQSSWQRRNERNICGETHTRKEMQTHTHTHGLSLAYINCTFPRGTGTQSINYVTSQEVTPRVSVGVCARACRLSFCVRVCMTDADRQTVICQGVDEPVSDSQRANR